MAQHGLVGVVESPIDLSYLSDAVLLLRFFESQGKVRKAISVLKKRVGTHEDTIREFRLTAQGLKVSLTSRASCPAFRPTLDRNRY
jgi:circadian clock protein KaiC